MATPVPAGRARGLVLACILLGSLAVVLHAGSAQRDCARALPALPDGVDALLPVPPRNRLSPQKVELGRRLFFDPRLSRDGTVSCATCHRPELAFTDGRPRARGIGGQRGRRNTPSLVNCAYRRSLFWDGRAASLEAQALTPIENPHEMGHSIAAVLAMLRQDDDYVRRFAAAFGSRDVTGERLAHALASFQRTLVGADAPFDRGFEDSADDAAGEASRAAARGFALFEGKARCRFCHQGAQFTDERFHNTGVGWGEEPLDLGAFEATGRDADRGRFRTPTLRGLVHTAPYMHDGSLATLRDVVDFYDRGAGPNPNVDAALRPLGLSAQEKDDLVAFLESLSGPAPAAR